MSASVFMAPVCHALAFSVLLVPIAAQKAGSRILGTVRGADGAPAVGAQVRAVAVRPRGLPQFLAPSLGRFDHRVGSAKTDTRGRFTLEIERPEAVALIATLGKYRSTTIYPVAPGSVVTVRLHPLHRLQGRLVVSGRPGGGGGVRIRAFASERPSREPVAIRDPTRAIHYGLSVSEAETNEDGTFELAIPSAGDWIVDCPQLAIVKQLPRGARPKVLELKQYCSERKGRVLDARSGEPIAGARVGWSKGGSALPSSPTRSRDDGRFAIRVPGDPYLYWSATGYQPDIALATSKEVRLQRGHKTRIRFVDRNRSPLAGASVIIVHWTNGALASGPLAIRAKLAEDGGLDCLGSYRVTCYLRESSRLTRLATLPGKRESKVIVNASRHDLRGTVLGPDGAPLAGIGVHLWRRGAPPLERYRVSSAPVAYTDRTGRFEVQGLVDGAYRIAVRGPRSLAGIATAHVAADREPMTLQLAAAPMVHGTVEDGSGRPVVGRWVGLHQAKIDPSARPWFGSVATFVRTDSEGRFALPASALDEEHVVSVRRVGELGSAVSRRVKPPQREVRIVLPAK